MQTDLKDCALTGSGKKESRKKDKYLCHGVEREPGCHLESALCFIHNGLERRDLSKTRGTGQLLAELGLEPRSSWGFPAHQLISEEKPEPFRVFVNWPFKSLGVCQAWETSGNWAFSLSAALPYQFALALHWLHRAFPSSSGLGNPAEQEAMEGPGKVGRGVTEGSF